MSAACASLSRSLDITQDSGGVALRRLRVMHLPLCAVEWTLPGDAPQLAPVGPPPRPLGAVRQLAAGITAAL